MTQVCEFLSHNLYSTNSKEIKNKEDMSKKEERRKHIFKIALSNKNYYHKS